MNAKTVIDLICTNKMMMKQHAERLAGYAPRFNNCRVESTADLVDAFMRTNVQGVADVMCLMSVQDDKRQRAEVIEIEPQLIESGGDKS